MSWYSALTLKKQLFTSLPVNHLQAEWRHSWTHFSTSFRRRCFHVNTHLHTHAATCSVNERQTNILSHLSGGTLHPQHPGKTNIPGALRQVIDVHVPPVLSRLVSLWDFPDNFVEVAMPLNLPPAKMKCFQCPKNHREVLSYSVFSSVWKQVTKPWTQIRFLQWNV